MPTSDTAASFYRIGVRFIQDSDLTLEMFCQEEKLGSAFGYSNPEMMT